MDSHTLLSEFKRFMKQEKGKLLALSITFAILIFLVQLIPFGKHYIAENFTDKDKNKTETSIENPAIFEVYIEYETGSVFTNTLLLEEAMKTDSHILAAEKETGIEISDLLDKEDETGYVKTARDRGTLGASRNEASNIWVVSAKVGTEQENLEVINYFYNLYQEQAIDLLENKPYYILSEPRVLSDDELKSPETPVEQDMTGVLSIKNLVLYAVIAVLGGTVLSTILLLFIPFTKKKIQYAFNYSWNEDDTFILLLHLEKNELEKVVMVPATASKLFLIQEAASLDQLTDLQNKATQLQIEESIVNLDTTTTVEEVIILIQPNITDKAWYNQQRELLKIYQAPLKIIQLND
ncbi:hypothetical protein LZ578_09725 [Jeotgalibaca sp. MA1X17-3]|uniref:hypothetical protein n=1 Tax=Jeotgalibaca sp. MA1X17-3 TaxID=2908211 RepID=UPI001F2917DD|nr:hypothetical protein [Jeotgalibaca sp. MA1X17-3]UJF15244.1 hypothetical protein LZ578_09725 [Jeotgalibaca sp. MA1X17-3]